MSVSSSGATLRTEEDSLEEYRVKLEATLKKQAADHAAEKRSLEQTIRDLTNTVADRDRTIAAQAKMIADRVKEILGRDATIASQAKEMADQRTTIADQAVALKNQMLAIAGTIAANAKHNATIAAQATSIAGLQLAQTGHIITLAGHTQAMAAQAQTITTQALDLLDQRLKIDALAQQVAKINASWRKISADRAKLLVVLADLGVRSSVKLLNGKKLGTNLDNQIRFAKQIIKAVRVTTTYWLKRERCVGSSFEITEKNCGSAFVQVMEQMEANKTYSSCHHRLMGFLNAINPR